MGVLSCPRTGAAVGVASSIASRPQRLRVEAVGIGCAQRLRLLAADLWVAFPVKVRSLEHGAGGIYASGGCTGLVWLR